MSAARRSASIIMGSRRTSPAVAIPVISACDSAQATAASTLSWSANGSYHVVWD
jgi:hypothetical protein